MKQEETAKLTASLSNYYNEDLIGHVLGWQADVVEKQVCERFIIGDFETAIVSYFSGYLSL